MAPEDSRDAENDISARGPIVDMSQVVSRSRNMLDPELIMRWDSYMADMTALAVQMMTQAAVAAKTGLSQPEYLELTEFSPGSKDVVATPVLKKGPATVDVRWVGKTDREPRIDFRRFMLLGRFKIQYGMKAYIPVSRPSENDPSMIFKFSEAHFAELSEGKRRKKAPGNQANPGTGTTGQGGTTNQG